MKWYSARLDELENAAPVLSVCGDDCAVCPRYLARTEDELRETAVFWYKAGWRDRILPPEEMRCRGCGTRGTCSYQLLPCTREHQVSRCADCASFVCGRVAQVYESSELKKQQCREACDSDAEFRMLCRAFYEKEKNMRNSDREG